MRKHNDLEATLHTSANLVNGLVAAEGVQARKRIVEDNYLATALSVLFKFREKKAQSEGAAVASTQRVPKAWPV
jgi:hypothetical protein